MSMRGIADILTDVSPQILVDRVGSGRTGAAGESTDACGESAG